MSDFEFDPFAHTCGMPGRYLSTACGAATVDRKLHDECRRQCKWCRARCCCRSCQHTGPLAWEFTQVGPGRWLLSADGQAPRAVRLPGDARHVEILVEVLRDVRWLGEHTPVTVTGSSAWWARPWSWWVRLREWL